VLGAEEQPAIKPRLRPRLLFIKHFGVLEYVAGHAFLAVVVSFILEFKNLQFGRDGGGNARLSVES
jgi:hypothetical protein